MDASKSADFKIGDKVYFELESFDFVGTVTQATPQFLEVLGVTRGTGLREAVSCKFLGTPNPHMRKLDDAEFARLVHGEPVYVAIWGGMQDRLREALERMDEVEQGRISGKIPPVAAGREREALLAEALRCVATLHGVILKEPLQIDSRGEFSIVAMTPATPSRGETYGRFGDAFAALLTANQPRCGISPGALLEGNAGWCHMNHFMVENLVRSYAETLTLAPATKKLQP